MTESAARVDTRLGRSLVNQLYIVLRTVRIHEPNNASAIHALTEFLSILRNLTSTWESVSLECLGGCLYVNGTRLKVDVSSYASHRYVVEEMEKFGLRSITLLEQLGFDELRAFAYGLKQLEGTQPDSDKLARLLEEKGASNILIGGVKGPDQVCVEKKAEDASVVAKKTFLSAIKIVRQIMNSASRFEAVKLRRATRAVQGIVDSILNDESFMLGLATIKNHDEYTFNHSVNVCIYCVSMGQRLGLSRSRLGQLGMAALFHDLGKVEIPWEILNKPTGLDEQELQLVKDHTVHGARLLARLTRLDDRSLSAIIVAYEHHLNYDLSGYPVTHRARSTHLFSRIVRIADAFDAMTTVRIYRSRPSAPHESVLLLLREAGRCFDSRLVKVFVSVVGFYPVGTVLELDTGETVVVAKPARDVQDIARPLVKVVADENGLQCGSETLNLAEIASHGGYTRNVKCVVQADKYGLNVPELLLGPLEEDVLASDSNLVSA
jgi:HD-GYP domain-containing protein (c-di-GMP phosphodiesterase class II)